MATGPQGTAYSAAGIGTAPSHPPAAAPMSDAATFPPSAQGFPMASTPASKPASYNTVAKLFHWIMAAIIITAWIIGFYSSHFLSYADPGSHKADVITLHKEIASTVMFLATLRLLWRLGHPVPDFPPSMGPLVQAAAHAGHVLLYVLMLAVPISGWAYSSAAGYAVPVAWLFHLPALVGQQDEARLAVFGKVHVYLAWTFGLVIVGHAFMAFKHQYVDRDGTLDKMLFRRRA